MNAVDFGYGESVKSMSDVYNFGNWLGVVDDANDRFWRSMELEKFRGKMGRRHNQKSEQMRKKEKNVPVLQDRKSDTRFKLYNLWANAMNTMTRNSMVTGWSESCCVPSRA